MSPTNPLQVAASRRAVQPPTKMVSAPPHRADAIANGLGARVPRRRRPRIEAPPVVAVICNRPGPSPKLPPARKETGDMAIKLDLVGKKSGPVPFTYTWKDVVLYALGVGAKAEELDFLYEMKGP